jgi:SAM-dependent methyltransferase
MLHALTEAWDRPRELASACISLVKLNGLVQDFIGRTEAIWPARLPAAELRGPLMSTLAGDQLLCSLLKTGIVTDVPLERLLTNVRCAILMSADEAFDERTLDFCCALARQCFINNYVFSITETEASEAQLLRTSLASALASAAPYSALLLSIAGAYHPLHALPGAEALLDRAWPPSVDALLDQQVREPAEERRLAPEITVMSSIEGAVSDAVRQQYEESPYPRWVKAGMPGLPVVLRNRPPEQGFDALVAGCGTGLSAIEFAQQTPRARVLAIDLSLASLSYACRMARAYGLTNIEFGQADIGTLSAIGREFDYIDASGVLHHLADPWEGWRLLLSQLRSGGVMQVGLYSALARVDVTEARALIAERGYRPVPEDIRTCREAVIAAEEGSLLRSIIRWKDFFSLNECRDLLFHVREHRVSLPEIKSFLATNGLQFVGFMLDAPTFQRFATRFPEPSARRELDCWKDFEVEAPDTFAGMYQFWIHKLPGP